MENAAGLIAVTEAHPATDGRGAHRRVLRAHCVEMLRTARGARREIDRKDNMITTEYFGRNVGAER